MTARGWSLRGRLSRNVLLVAGAGWLAGLMLGVLVLDHEMQEVLDEGLRSEARLVLAVMEGRGSESLAHWQAVEGHEQDLLLRVLSAGGPAPPAPWPELTKDGLRNSGDWRVLRASSGSHVVEIGQSRDWRREELWEAGQGLFLLMLPVLLLLLPVIHLSLRNALRPAQAFAQAVAARPADDLAPFAADGLPAELSPLRAALNGYLGRLSQAVEAERQFAAHAAHELRTPVAAAKARLQPLKADPQLGADARAVDRQLDQLSARLAQLLQLARAEAGLGLVGGRVDLLRILRLVIEELPAGHRPVLLDDGDIEEMWLDTDADALAILLRNLIGNACQHGTGPVRVRLSGDARLLVENPVTEGAAFRFARFDKAPLSEGSGLGLTIVDHLARQMGLPLVAQMQGGLAQVVLDLSARRADLRASR